MAATRVARGRRDVGVFDMAAELEAGEARGKGGRPPVDVARAAKKGRVGESWAGGGREETHQLLVPRRAPEEATARAGFRWGTDGADERASRSGAGGRPAIQSAVGRRGGGGQARGATTRGWSLFGALWVARAREERRGVLVLDGCVMRRCVRGCLDRMLVGRRPHRRCGALFCAARVERESNQSSSPPPPRPVAARPPADAAAAQDAAAAAAARIRPLFFARLERVTREPANPPPPPPPPPPQQATMRA
jgi:hypothetical protein